jgi:hypothetical protein
VPIALLLLLSAGPALAQPGPAAPGVDEDKARQTSTITIYPHVFFATAGFPMPGNTQFPAGEDDFSAGFPGNGCFPKAVAGPLGGLPPVGEPTGAVLDPVEFRDCDTWTNNVLYVYSTAGFVHADMDTWDYAQFHNERGQAKDVLLDTTKDVEATFYMSADWHGWGYCGFGVSLPGLPSPVPCWNWDPGFFPQWQVEATLFLGEMGEYQGQASEPPPVHDKVTGGSVVEVARGMSEPQDMLSLDSTLNGGHGEVYEFNINLGKPKVDVIPKAQDWIMRFRWWIREGDNTLLLGQRFNWNINSGEFYPNRFTLPVRNPFDVELVYPQFLHDRVVILALLNSPWGSYDVDSRTVQMTITDDGHRPVVPQRISQVADYSVAHGGHYKPVNVTWVWDYKSDRLAPGTYEVTVTASNFQHSAISTTQAQFRLRPDGTGETVSVGRSGQQTFTEDQLGGLTASADGGEGLQGSAAPASPEPAPAPRAAPGAEAPLLLAGIAVLALLQRRRSA